MEFLYDLLFKFIQIQLLIILLLLIFPFIHYFVLNFFYLIIGFPLGIQPDILEGYFNMIFFPGTLMKLFVRTSMIHILGGNMGRNFGMNFYGVYSNGFVNFDRKLSKEMIFILSPYVLFLLEFFFAIFFNDIAEFLSYNGLPLIAAYALIIYLMISIFITGLPTPYDAQVLFFLFVHDHPLVFFMLLGILFNSIMFIPYFGLDIASTIAYLQIIFLLIFELRTARILRIINNPDQYPEEFLDLVNLGVI